MKHNELVNRCYDSQEGNPKWGSWEISIRDEVYKIGLEYICLHRKGKELQDTLITCNDIIRQQDKEKMGENISLVQH